MLAPMKTQYDKSGPTLVKAMKKRQFDACYCSTAEEAVEKAGVSHRWHGHLGDAARVIPTLEGPYDFVFLDGPKGQYLRELKMLEPLLTAHAVIAADNVLFRGLVMAEGQVPHRYRTLVMRLRDYIRYVNSAYDTIIDEEGDGLAVSVKR